MRSPARLRCQCRCVLQSRNAAIADALSTSDTLPFPPRYPGLKRSHRSNASHQNHAAIAFATPRAATQHSYTTIVTLPIRRACSRHLAFVTHVAHADFQAANIDAFPTHIAQLLLSGILGTQYPSNPRRFHEDCFKKVLALPTLEESTPLF